MSKSKVGGSRILEGRSIEVASPVMYLAQAVVGGRF
jgi:hypothetical protein